jgi:MFS-type transporter involved in bile tolerance (Atg22 family)
MMLTDLQRTKWYQVREAFTDWMTWPPFFFVICNQIANGGLVIFSGLIVSGLGFSKLETTLLGIPTGMIATFAGILMAYISARFKNGKCITTIVFALIPIACAILMMSKSPRPPYRSRIQADLPDCDRAAIEQQVWPIDLLLLFLLLRWGVSFE